MEFETIRTHQFSSPNSDTVTATSRAIGQVSNFKHKILNIIQQAKMSNKFEYETYSEPENFIPLISYEEIETY